MSQLISRAADRLHPATRPRQSDSVPLLRPQGIEHIVPRQTSLSRIAELGRTASRIVSGGRGHGHGLVHTSHPYQDLRDAHDSNHIEHTSRVVENFG